MSRIVGKKEKSHSTSQKSVVFEQHVICGFLWDSLTIKHIVMCSAWYLLVWMKNEVGNILLDLKKLPGGQ